MFVEDTLPTLNFDDEDDEGEDELKQASFIFGSVLPTLALYYKKYYVKEKGDDVKGSLPDDPSERLAPHMADLYANARAQQHMLPPEPVQELAQALASHGFAAADLGVSGGGIHNAPSVYDDARIRERSRIIGYAIDARRQRFPNENPYQYVPFFETGEHPVWDQAAKSTMKDYNLLDLSI